MGEALKVVDENLAESPSCSQAEANHGDEGDGRSPKRRRSQGAEDALEVHFSSHSTHVFPHMPHKKRKVSSISPTIVLLLRLAAGS